MVISVRGFLRSSFGRWRMYLLMTASESSLMMPAPGCTFNPDLSFTDLSGCRASMIGLLAARSPSLSAYLFLGTNHWISISQEETGRHPFGFCRIRVRVASLLSSRRRWLAVPQCNLRALFGSISLPGRGSVRHISLCWPTAFPFNLQVGVRVGTQVVPLRVKEVGPS